MANGNTAEATQSCKSAICFQVSMETWVRGAGISLLGSEHADTSVFSPVKFRAKFKAEARFKGGSALIFEGSMDWQLLLLRLLHNSCIRL